MLCLGCLSDVAGVYNLYPNGWMEMPEKFTTLAKVEWEKRVKYAMTVLHHCREALIEEHGKVVVDEAEQRLLQKRKKGRYVATY